MSNRLAQTKSLYLRKHADNPINWWFWGEEALATAKAENKPIFLSIGYSSCHWCTVMEGEAFSNQGIADYMNEHFLPIKVDREERPDIDSIYMQALQMMTGQGGWPLNIFLTPDDLVPFYGGTYFPVEPRYGRPGFLQVLQSIRRFYDQETEKLELFKREIVSNLQRAIMLPVTASDSLGEELLSVGIKTSASIINRNDFGYPRFPMIPYAALVLQGREQELAEKRGEELALGGIYDHVGGGFHRYTVDSTWTVPHFEKMLYDNGQIVEYLANLWSAGIQEQAFFRAIVGTVQWLKREMTAPQGYFYAAQDADSFLTKEDKEPEEGAFYVWQEDFCRQLLTEEEFTALQEQFTLSAQGNFEGKNVLQRRHPGELSPVGETALDKLFAVRYGAAPSAVPIFPPATNNQEAKATNWAGRIPPVTDTKMIVAWNSLMISGLARAYGVFGDGTYWELATRAAKFILQHQVIDGRLYRLNYEGEATVLAQAEDYALLIKALLDLQSNNPQAMEWVEQAIALQAQFDEFFWSVELGGYFSNARDDSSDLLIRERGLQDNATPSANGVALANLIRLGLLTEKLEYLERAEQGLQAFGSVLQESPQSCPSLVTALDWYLHGSLVRTTAEYLPDLIPQYFPTTVYRIDPELPENVVGIVCKGLSCLPPSQSIEELKDNLFGWPLV
jgi:uncharacterized protein YyaL (SSP411 family)